MLTSCFASYMTRRGAILRRRKRKGSFLLPPGDPAGDKAAWGAKSLGGWGAKSAPTASALEWLPPNRSGIGSGIKLRIAERFGDQRHAYFQRIADTCAIERQWR